ncbi:hypothetical protein Mal4_28630 [Maioricimonas rarisocia]|uniref:Uncharacterized protein n=1 Tax=Maioricimonas rarisocia TaxID=2528026 RepID=A0A517Z7U1_9PLAN|nr:hypothetical protein [Maioricimonas rarisocia]QDU38534.1 hypothetical protein Mal4_28630 [Maioricimonas rarisocia]
MRASLLCCLTVLPLTVLLVGCTGSGIATGDMSGTVTFNGEPVPYGTIEFHPASESENPGPTVSTEIHNGTFDTAESGTAVVRGPLEIRITAYPSEPADLEDETAEAEVVEPYFVGYTVEMDYTAEPVEIAVPEDAEGFDIYARND